MTYSQDLIKLNPILILNKKGNKYNAKRTEFNGECFDSKREAEYYLELCCRQRNGELNFIMQVPFPLLNGKVKYVADFLVFYPGGRCEINEVKGFRTDGWKIKKAAMAVEYPFIKLMEIK